MDSGAAFRSLGGLGHALEAEGWTLSPLRGAIITPGDILDPTDNQVIVSGSDCFDRALVRTGQGVSADLSKALQVGARSGVVGANGGLKGNATLEVGIDRAEIAEIPLVSLLPSPTCTASLHRLSQQGYPVGNFVVIQSVLWADLGVASCLGANVEARTPAIAGDLGAESCRNLSGTRVAIGLRTANVAKVFDLVGPPSLGREGTDNAPRARVGRKAKKKGPPCWILEPCAPYEPANFLIGVGQAADPGLADQAALTTLLQPFEVRYRALQSSTPPTTANTLQVGQNRQALAAEARVAERYNDGSRFFSLVVLERSPAIERRRAELPQHPQSSGANSGPLHNLRSACGALPGARREALLHAELGVLSGLVSRPARTLQSQVEACDQARVELRLALPVAGFGGQLGLLASAQGFTVLAEGDARSNVAVTSTFDTKESMISGMWQVNVEAQATLTAAHSPPIVLRVTTSGASKDIEKARRSSRMEAEAELARQIIQAILESFE